METKTLSSPIIQIPITSQNPFNSTGLIYKKIISVLKEIEAISKDHKDEEHNFMFRSIDDIYNALNPLFKKHGIFTTSEVVNSAQSFNGNVKKIILDVKFTFFAEDGSSVSSTTRGESVEKEDKGTSIAQSFAHKYALTQMFLIPTSNENPSDPRRWMPEGHLSQFLKRIKAGEHGLYARADKEYRMKDEYRIKMRDAEIEVNTKKKK